VSKVTTRRPGWQLAVAGAAALLLPGCAGTQDVPAASAARGLLEAAHSGDGTGACELLAPAARSELEQQAGTSCEEAILEEDLGEGSGEATADVFDTMAQVRVGEETVFLSRYDGRWLVVGAACTPVPGRPYDCSIGLP
jgi:hypothetical protein